MNNVGGKMESLISVIVPVYNVEQYLNRCIDSIIKQTYKNLEIILIDDGSTDSSGKLCDNIKQKDARIIVLHKINGGLSSARNVGLDNMTGEYVMFVDSDDYISEDCVEYLYDLIVKTKSRIAIGNYKMTNSSQCLFLGVQENVEQISSREALNRQFGKDTVQYVSAWAKLYEAELFKQLRFPEGRLHEDEGTTYKALYFSDNVVVSNKAVYAYYYNSESITKKPKKKNYQDLCLILKEQIAFYHNNNTPVLEARVKNRYCIQAAAHYLPKGYYEDPQVIVQEARKMYKGVWHVSEIPAVERLKGWIGAYCCPIAAKRMSNKAQKSK